MRTARFIIGLALACAPFVCAAQESGTGATTGSGTIADPHQELMDRLDALAESGMLLSNVQAPSTIRAAWAEETARYAERSTELRSRCHDELRKANRDTIAEKGALCLRADVMLEIGLRRKQRDVLAATPGIDSDTLESATAAIDSWIDAATTVVDGADAGVFRTIDTLKQVKRNLHAGYRMPMLVHLTFARVALIQSLIRSLALETAAALRASESDSLPFLEQIVPCLENARQQSASVPSTSHVVLMATDALRTCITIVRDARRA